MAARQYFSAFKSEVVTGSSTTVWTDVLSLTFTPDANSDYVVFWSGLVLAPSTSFDGRLRILVDGATKTSLNIEPNFSFEPFNTGAFFRVQGGSSPTPVTITLQCQTENATYPTRVASSSIVALKLSPDDIYVENTALVTNTSSTPSTILSTSFTPPSAGNYVAVGGSLTKNASTSVAAYLGLTVNGSQTEPFGNVGHDVTNWTSITVLHRLVNVSTTQNVDLWAQAHTSGPLGSYQERRLLILRESDFDAVHVAVNPSNYDSVEGSGAPVYPASLTEPRSANPHLVLANWSFSADSSGIPVTIILDDGNGSQNFTRNTVAIALIRHAHGGQTFYINEGIAAGSNTWRIGKYGNGSNTTRLVGGSGFFSFDLGSDTPPPPTRRKARYSFAL